MMIPIVMASDDNYAPALGVAILSMQAHQENCDTYALHILYTDLSRPNIDRLENLSCSNFLVRCIKISPPELPKTAGWISKETYYRLFAADLLSEYDKILYLDCDVIVLSDLVPLYAQELGNMLVGGVGDFRFDGGYAQRVIGVPTENYINAGVLLINASLWRNDGIAHQCLAFLRENRQLEAYDQDAINFVCMGRIRMLEKKWNFQQVWPEIFNWHPQHRAFRENACVPEDEAFIFSGSGILHYVCAEKPWHDPSREFSEYFWSYARGSLFYEMFKQPAPSPLMASSLPVRGVTCLLEHGLGYTLKRIVVKITDWRR